LAQLSISSNLQYLHNSSRSFKCYSIHCMCQLICDVTSSNFLERLVQYDGTGGGGLVYTPKGFTENSMAMCGFGCKNPSVGSLHKWSWKTDISLHRASMQCSSTVYLLELVSILPLPKQLDYKCAQNNRVQSYM